MTTIYAQHCYDFPEVVIHRPDCPRYSGGICRPLSQPTEPYTDEERVVVAAYQESRDDIMESVHRLRHGMPPLDGHEPIDADGSTIYPAPGIHD